MKTIVQIITGLFTLLFLYAAGNKLLDYQKFKVQVGQSPILTRYAAEVALIVPIMEIAIAVLLLRSINYQKGTITALFASYGIMVMFSAYIVVILNFTERIPCSCGGILDQMGWTTHLIFNLVFVAMAIAGIIIQYKIEQRKANYKPV
jgi:hypothetical protein